MRKCYICDAHLSAANKSDEHILPNACGGRLKSRHILCSDCNSTLGASVDAALAEQLNTLTNIFDIKRERGSPQKLKAENPETGEQYLIAPGGKPEIARPTVKAEEQEDYVTISIVAKDEVQLKQILTGYKRKYPKLDIDQSITQARAENHYLDNSLRIRSSIGGDEPFKAICKTAINYYMYEHGDSRHVKHLIPYLKKEKEISCVAHYSSEEFLADLSNKELSHIVHLRGCNEDKVLYCYIEYFNSYCFVILLNDHYDGENINSTYRYDLLDQKKKKKPVSLNLKKSEILCLLDGEHDFLLPIKTRLSRTLQLAASKQHEEHRKELISRAIDKTLGSYPEGTIITEDIINEMVNEITRAMMPYIQKRLLKSRLR